MDSFEDLPPPSQIPSTPTKAHNAPELQTQGVAGSEIAGGSSMYVCIAIAVTSPHFWLLQWAELPCKCAICPFANTAEVRGGVLLIHPFPQSDHLSPSNIDQYLSNVPQTPESPIPHK